MQSLLYTFEKYQARCDTYTAGDSLVMSDKALEVYLLKSGMVANVCNNDQKACNPIKIIAPVSLLGVESVFDNQLQNSHYITISEVELLAVPAEVFKLWMNNNVELRMMTLINLHQQVEVVEAGLQNSSSLNMIQRLKSMAKLLKKSGIQGQEVHLKAQEIAKLCRCTVDVLRREWKELVQDVPAKLILD